MLKRPSVQFIIVALGILFVVSLIQVPDAPTQPSTPTTQTPTPCPRPRERDAIRIYINEARLKEGLAQTSDMKVLQDYAEFRLKEITDSGQFTHETSLEFQDWVVKNNRLKEVTSLRSAGSEVLVEGSFSSCEVVDAWLNSPTHKDVLFKADHIGIALNDKYAVVITGENR